VWLSVFIEKLYIILYTLKFTCEILILVMETLLKIS